MRVLVSASLLLITLLLCPTAFCPAALASEDVLDELRRKAAGMHSVQSDFVQETAIPMFAQPLRSFGRFAFKRPASLLWEYVDPIQEGFVLQEKSGFSWSGDKSQRTAFVPGSNLVATIIARQIIAWITFDIHSIEREYAIVRENERPLRLRMIPLREDMLAVIKSISITFTESGPAERVEINEQHGGTTTIFFSNTSVNTLNDEREFQ